MKENGSAITEYSWDGTTGQLNWVKNQFNETTSYDYDPTLGHLVKKTMHDGQYEEYSYDSRYRLWLSQVVDSGTSVLHETEYVFNAASEVESTYIDSDQTDYVYDDASQLEQESRSGYTCDYTYDDNGNRLSKAISGGITETYNYDPEERLTSVTWNGGSNYKNFTYDDGGRVTAINNTGSTRTFTYDEESRLTAISGAYTASYEYNGLRTRVEKTEASVTRTFLRDGAGPTSPVLNDGAAAYTPGTSERRGGTTTYMHSGIKNADFQTNTSEAQTGERVYDAFGNLTASSGSFVGPFGYGGQFGYQEDGSGLKLLGNRYYDPSIGRFLTRDLIKDGTNWYAYCENNPVIWFDAAGLWILSGGFGIQHCPTLAGFSGSISVGASLDLKNGHFGPTLTIGGGWGAGSSARAGFAGLTPSGNIDGSGYSDWGATGIAVPLTETGTGVLVEMNDPQGLPGKAVFNGGSVGITEGVAVYHENRRSFQLDLVDLWEKFKDWIGDQLPQVVHWGPIY